VRAGTRYAASESVQVSINACGQLRGDRIFERPSALGIGGWNVERPEIAGFDEVFTDTYRRQGSAPHRDERELCNDQSVPVLERMRLGYPPGGVGIGDRPVHELEPQRVQALTGNQVIFPGCARCGGGHALADGQQPRPNQRTGAHW
jgi:hypothetical protein